MKFTLFNCNNCFNRNAVTIIGRWNRWTIGLALTFALAPVAYFLLQ